MKTVPEQIESGAIKARALSKKGESIRWTQPEGLASGYLP